MNRPCDCNRFTPGEPYRDGDCRPCWLYHNDPRYAKLWSGECKVRVKRTPTIGEKLVTVATAYGRWVLAGRPRRTAEEIAAIQSICDNCEHHARQHGHNSNACQQCGCNLTTKISMATEFCPLGMWPCNCCDKPSAS